jgi:hypothetical protein
VVPLIKIKIPNQGSTRPCGKFYLKKIKLAEIWRIKGSLPPKIKTRQNTAYPASGGVVDEPRLHGSFVGGTYTCNCGLSLIVCTGVSIKLL